MLTQHRQLTTPLEPAQHDPLGSHNPPFENHWARDARVVTLAFAQCKHGYGEVMASHCVPERS